MLDKLRERAQYPDCIFAAFPDGESGKIYNPRGDASDELIFWGRYSPDSKPVVENGMFVTRAKYAQTGFRYNAEAAKGARKFTLICSIKVDRPNDGAVIYPSVLMLSGGAGSYYTGLGWQVGTITQATRPNMSLNPFMRYTNTDGSTIYGFQAGGMAFPWDEWHTVACTIDMDAGTITGYLDGVKKVTGTAKTFPIVEIYPALTQFSFCDMQTNPNGTGTLNDKPMSSKYGLIFTTILSDDELKYLMQE